MNTKLENNLDKLETNSVKEFNDVQMDWVLGEVRAIRNYLDSIEHEANKGKRGDFISLGYIFEKTNKARSSLDTIEQRANLFNHPS